VPNAVQPAAKPNGLLAGKSGASQVPLKTRLARPGCCAGASLRRAGVPWAYL